MLFTLQVVTMFTDISVGQGPGLLTPPSEVSATFTRVSNAHYANQSECYRLGERSFARQYAHIYATRLLQMRPLLVERAKKKWGELAANNFYYTRLGCRLPE